MNFYFLSPYAFPNDLHFCMSGSLFAFYFFVYSSFLVIYISYVVFLISNIVSLLYWNSLFVFVIFVSIRTSVYLKYNDNNNVSIRDLNLYYLQLRTALSFFYFSFHFLLRISVCPIFSRVWCWTVVSAHYSRIKIRIIVHIFLRRSFVSYLVHILLLSCSFYWTSLYSHVIGLVRSHLVGINMAEAGATSPP